MAVREWIQRNGVLVLSFMTVAALSPTLFKDCGKEAEIKDRRDRTIHYVDSPAAGGVKALDDPKGENQACNEESERTACDCAPPTPSGMKP